MITKRDFIINTIIFIASLVIVLLLIELALQIIHYDQEGIDRIKLKKDYYNIIQTTEWGSSYKPNQTVTMDYTGREKKTILINLTTIPVPGYETIGTRDVPIKKDTKIIMTLGDSYTWGATLNHDQIWREIIENRNKNLTLFSLPPAASITQAYHLYTKLEPTLPEHEVVIYALGTVNEFLDNYAFKEAKESNKLNVTTNKLPFYYPIITRSRLAYIFYSFYAKINMPIKNLLYKLSNKIEAPVDYLPEVDGYIDPYYGEFDITPPKNQIGLNYVLKNSTNLQYLEGLEEAKKSIHEFGEYTKSKNKKLIVVIIPFKEQIYIDLIKDKIKYEIEINSPNKEILKSCKKANIICLDSTEYLMKHKDKKLFWDYDRHLTPEGQIILADYIESELKNLEFI